MRKLEWLAVTCLAVAGCSKRPTVVADLVLLSSDIFTREPDKILRMWWLSGTVVGGKEVDKGI